MTLTANIETLALKKGIPVDKMLKDLGISTNSFYRWGYQGKNHKINRNLGKVTRVPNRSGLQKIADYLDLPDIYALLDVHDTQNVENSLGNRLVRDFKLKQKKRFAYDDANNCLGNTVKNVLKVTIARKVEDPTLDINPIIEALVNKRTHSKVKILQNIVFAAVYLDVSLDYMFGLSEQPRSIKDPKYPAHSKVTDWEINQIAEQVKNLCNLTTTSLEDLTDATSVSAITIYRWYDNRSAPAVKSLFKIVKYFDVSLDYLFNISTFDKKVNLQYQQEQTKATIDILKELKIDKL